MDADKRELKKILSDGERELYVPQLPPPRDYLIAAAAAKRLGLSAITIRVMVRNKLLTPGYIGKNLYVSIASVEEYERTRKEAGRPKGSLKK
jgi:hypothetical protein